MSNENLKQKFSLRILENYESFLKDWLSQEPEELVSYAEEIAATKLLSKSVVEVVSAEDMEFLMQFENPLEVIRDGWMNYKQADITDELQYVLSYAKSNPSMWDDYAKVTAASSEPLSVCEFLEGHPGETFDMMTPGGYVYLTPEKAQHLLAGGTVMGNPGCPGFDMRIIAEELLDQVVCSANFSEGEWHILSNYVPELEQSASGMEVLKDKRGEGYIDVVVLVLCAMLVIALAVKVFPVYIAKQTVDTFATELIREAEIAGQVGSETSRREQYLREKTGLNPTVTWSTRGRIQLNEEVSVTVTYQTNIGLFANFGSFPITLRADAAGRSEVYWK